MLGALKAWTWRALAFFLLLQMMLVAAVLSWPDFFDEMEGAGGTIRFIAKYAGVDDLLEKVDELGLMGYVTGQHLFKGCNTLGTAAAVLFAVGAVAGEAQRGTLEIWIARPVSRARLLIERYVSGALALAIPVMASTATIPWLLTYLDESLELRPLLLCAAHQSILLLACYSLTFLASARGRNPVAIGVLMLFVFTFEFAIYVVKNTKEYSMYRLSDLDRYKRIFDTGGLDWRFCAPMLAVSAICLALSLRAFGRRTP